ncbi:MAG: hypothetical protein RLY45_1573, partial [Actinomycetota bacterium]
AELGKDSVLWGAMELAREAAGERTL